MIIELHICGLTRRLVVMELHISGYSLSGLVLKLHFSGKPSSKVIIMNMHISDNCLNVWVRIFSSHFNMQPTFTTEFTSPAELRLGSCASRDVMTAPFTLDTAVFHLRRYPDTRPLDPDVFLHSLFLLSSHLSLLTQYSADLPPDSYLGILPTFLLIISILWVHPVLSSLNTFDLPRVLFYFGSFDLFSSTSGLSNFLLFFYIKTFDLSLSCSLQPQQRFDLFPLLSPTTRICLPSVLSSPIIAKIHSLQSQDYRIPSWFLQLHHFRFPSSCFTLALSSVLSKLSTLDLPAVLSDLRTLDLPGLSDLIDHLPVLLISTWFPSYSLTSALWIFLLFSYLSTLDVSYVLVS